MKLMKRNSSLNETPKKIVSASSIKFDWSKITEKNSSVHSEELNI